MVKQKRCLKLIKDQLPSIYHSLLDPKFLKLDILETKATCSDCLRSRDKRFQYAYDPNLKCCTFFPFFPNYAVGGIIKTYPSAAKMIRSMIKSRKFTLPIGLFPSPNYQFEFSQKSPTDFGVRDDLLCPFYDTKKNQCSVWMYRGVVCTTFFCTSNHGKAGIQFWRKTSDYLSLIELGLAEEVLVHLDFSPRDISDQLAFLNMKEWTSEQKNQTALKSSEMKKYWNGYEDPEAFYVKCFELIQSQKRKDIMELIGESGRKMEQAVIESGSLLCET